MRSIDCGLALCSDFTHGFGATATGAGAGRNPLSRRARKTTTALELTSTRIASKGERRRIRGRVRRPGGGVPLLETVTRPAGPGWPAAPFGGTRPGIRPPGGIVTATRRGARR
ncbi:hypothetical protein MXD62_32835 [Frankia sp. Mgl5]|uniref:hypothetical protein n=1 Tax=Frankia sp. Mgl5 TaxID=2933793 RepID=UPI00200C0A1A|nr:hypothetical protein [Frankia sp. Mgl5]MCK9931870.1 hypothetical protein [Frankia sp. Mgl5]